MSRTMCAKVWTLIQCEMQDLEQKLGVHNTDGFGLFEICRDKKPNGIDCYIEPCVYKVESEIDRIAVKELVKLIGHTKTPKKLLEQIINIKTKLGYE